MGLHVESWQVLSFNTLLCQAVIIPSWNCFDGFVWFCASPGRSMCICVRDQRACQRVVHEELSPRTWGSEAQLPGGNTTVVRLERLAKVTFEWCKISLITICWWLAFLVSPSHLWDHSRALQMNEATVQTQTRDWKCEGHPISWSTSVKYQPNQSKSSLFPPTPFWFLLIPPKNLAITTTSPWPSKVPRILFSLWMFGWSLARAGLGVLTVNTPRPEPMITDGLVNCCWALHEFAWPMPFWCVQVSVDSCKISMLHASSYSKIFFEANSLSKLFVFYDYVIRVASCWRMCPGCCRATRGCFTANHVDFSSSPPHPSQLAVNDSLFDKIEILYKIT